MRDYRENFYEYAARKPASWEDVIDKYDIYLDMLPEISNIVSAINDIILSTDEEFYFDYGVDNGLWEYDFSGISDPEEVEERIEFVVYNKGVGEYFYINTEGYGYPRYVVWIPFMTSAMRSIR